MVRHWMLVFAALFFVARIGRADWQEVQSVQPGAPILVQSGFLSDAGKFVSATTDTLVVETRAGLVTISKGDIDQVLVFRSKHERLNNGLFWGGVAAGVTAAAFFPLMASLSHSNYALAGSLTATNGTTIGLTRFVGTRVKRIYRRQ
jgi:hypothetical protein